MICVSAQVKINNAVLVLKMSKFKDTLIIVIIYLFCRGIYAGLGICMETVEGYSIKKG